MLQYVYFDCADAVRNSVNVWHALFDGKSFNFYSYTRYAEHNSTFTAFSGLHGGATYSWLAYFIYGIWNLPLYLFERFAAVNLFSSAWAVMYGKLGLVALSCCSAYLLQRIVRHVAPEHSLIPWMPMLYLTSSLFFSCTVAVGQMEALTVFFMLLGFERYIKKRISYLLFFMLAFCFKYLALLAFLPLLLLSEKNLLKIGGKTLLVILPTALLFVLFHADQILKVGVLANYSGTITDYSVAILSGGMLEEEAILHVGGMDLSLFFAALMVVLVLCYFHSADTDLERARWGSFFCTACLLSFIFFFTPMNPYWTLLSMPFGLLAVALNAKELRRALYAETLATTLLVCWQLFNYFWVFGLYAMQCNPFLLNRVPFASTTLSIRSVTNAVGSLVGLPVSDYVQLLLSTASILLAGYYVYLVYPQQRENGVSTPATVGVKEISIRLAMASLALLLPAASIYVAVWLGRGM